MDITSELLEKALSEYDSELDIQDFENFGEGDARDVFRIRTDSRELVLYLCTDTSPEYERRFKKEEKLIEKVNQNTRIPTQEMLYSDFSKDKVPYLFYIAKMIDGYNPINRFKYLPTNQKENIVNQVGKYLGELHREIRFEESGEIFLNEDKISVDREDWQQYLFSWAYQWIEKIGENRFSDLKEDIEKFLKDYSELAQNEDYFCCIHWDITPDNLIVKNGRVNAVIDWEKAISGPPEWDIAYSRVQMIYRWFESTRISRDLERHYIKGYKEERNLDEKWKKKVLYYGMIQSLRGMAEFSEWTEDAGLSEERKNQEEEFFRKLFEKRKNLDKAIKEEIAF